MNQPTSNCSCTLLHTEDFSSDAMVYALIRAPKGRGHILSIAGSHEFLRPRKCKVQQRIHSKLKWMDFPYTLTFIPGSTAIVCFWTFQDPLKETEKNWFDDNAVRGIYPAVPKTYAGREEGIYG